MGDQLNPHLNHGDTRKSEKRLADSRKSSKEIIENNVLGLMGHPCVQGERAHLVPRTMNAETPKPIHNILEFYKPKDKRENPKINRKDRNCHQQRSKTYTSTVRTNQS